MINKNLPIPKNEVARLDALAQYNILDTLPEEEFDRLTQLASIICGVPIALITLIDKDRQWFKSKIGLDAPETPRDISFCQYTINGESLFEIEDATKDQRFLSTSLVTDQPNIRFYAGYPLIDPDGYALGSLCVIDREARTLTADQRQCLTLLANEVVSQIVSRKKNDEKDKLEKMFNLSNELKCIIGSDGYLKKLNPAYTLTLGWTIEELLAKPFYDFIHPDDVTSTINEIKKIATGEKTINFENRLIAKKGDYLSISWNANPDEITGELYAVGRDITERKKAEEVLTEYKHFFYNTANLSCIANVQGYFEVINPNFEKILGYTEKELLESQFLNFIHPDDIDLTLKEIGKLQKGATTINFENRYRTKDGNYLWFNWNTTSNPVTEKIYAVARDITERKKAKKELEDYKFILDEASLVSITDEKGIILHVNQNFCNLSKYSREELIGQDHRIINSDYHTKAFMKNLWKTITTGKVWHEEVLNKAKDDSYFWTDTTIFPFLNTKGKPYKYMAIRSDITKRKEFEKSLEESISNMEAILESTADGILVVDEVGHIVRFNKKFQELWSFPEEVLHAMDDNKVLESVIDKLVNPQKMLAKVKELFENPEAISSDIIELKDGSLFDRYSQPRFMDGVHRGRVWSFRNITERKNIEKSLEDSLSSMEAILESTADGILVVDEGGNIVRFNKKFQELWSIPDEVMHTMDDNKALDSVLNQMENPQNFLAKVKELYANPEAISSDIIELKDGRVFERYSQPKVMNGVHSGRVWSYRNVTERINTEKEKQQLFALVETSQDFIAFGDLNGNPTFMNKAAREHLGIDDNKMLSNLKVHDFFDSKEIKFINDGFLVADGSIEKEGKWEGETHLLNIKTKKTIPVQMSAFVIRDNITGKAIGLGNISRDITKSKKEELLRKVLQEKYQNIIANMNLGLLEVDNNGIIQYANQSFVDISGYEISELLGKTPKELFAFGENSTIVDAKTQSREQGKSDSYQIQVKNKKGELRWWAVNGSPNYDDNGNLVGSIGVHLDITNQKQLEIDLENEKTKAQEASKAKESFLANMSHEIRTPLNAIIGFLRELEKQELSGLQKTYIDNSSIASKHLLDILNTILDLSKIEAGEMSLESEDFFIEDAINNVLKVLNLKAEQNEIRLSSIISDKVNKVFMGDSLRLEQILFNLVGNALKFTPKGKIEVSCELLSDCNTSQTIRISVADTGIGMEQKYAESIFEKFSQEDKSITRKNGGTGLGMAITKELVHLMGGEIEVESEKNKGTTIHVNINLIKGNIESVKKSPSEINFNLDGLSILLVEDNEMNRMVVHNALHYFNCNVTEAENGFEAVKILKTQNFDLILMDIQMPGMDGIEATKVIREELKLSTPIIALTANAFKTEIEKCKQAGMNDYVTKPFEETVLLQTIVKHTINKKGIPSLDNEINPNQPLYNLNVLRDLSRGNDEFVVKMVGVFVEQTIATIEKIDAALESNNFLEISRLIHKIRPSTDNMGVLSIQSEMKTLEKIAKETQNKGQITAIYKLVKKTLQLVISQLQKNE